MWSFKTFSEILHNKISKIAGDLKQINSKANSAKILHSMFWKKKLGTWDTKCNKIGRKWFDIRYTFLCFFFCTMSVLFFAVLDHHMLQKIKLRTKIRRLDIVNVNKIQFISIIYFFSDHQVGGFGKRLFKDLQYQEQPSRPFNPRLKHRYTFVFWVKI